MDVSLDYSSSSGEPPVYRRSLHWTAFAVTLSVFPLIWMGGLVTSHSAGMSVPDWPNSYGYNMVLFPPSQWLGGIFYEHTHRLLGTLSGLLSVLLVLLAWGPSRTVLRQKIFGWVTLLLLVAGVVALLVRPEYAGPPTPGVEGYDAKLATYTAAKNWSHVYVGLFSLALVAGFAWVARKREPRRWVRWLVVGQLLAIIVQGTMGGLRVTEVSLTLAMIHGCFAQLFFCCSAFTTLALSKWWLRTKDQTLTPAAPAGGAVLKWAAIASVLIFCQLVVGAVMRHNDAGLAIPDLPLHYGHVLPPHDAAGLDEANQIRAWNYDNLKPTTLPGIWTHFAHRTGAVLITIVVSGIAILVFRKLRQVRAIRNGVAILVFLVIVQVTLGVLTVYWMKPADVASLHVAVGALTFLTATQVVVVAARLFATRRVAEPLPDGRSVVG